MERKRGKWALGIAYLIAVASIWIAASFVVQSVLDGGASPFLITYICNSLFVVYIPLVEISRYLEDSYGGLLFWKINNGDVLPGLAASDCEQIVLLREGDLGSKSIEVTGGEPRLGEIDQVGTADSLNHGDIERKCAVQNVEGQIDQKGRWKRTKVAKVSLLICPFWFLAQLTFNLSLKYTTVTSNTILSSVSSLFTFLVSLVFLGEKFTWVKLVSILLCMTGTIIVSLADSEAVLRSTASNPPLGDVLAIVSAGLYAVYVSLIRIKLPDEDNDNSGHASMAQFFGFLGLFNMFLFLPVAVALGFANLESFSDFTPKQLGLVIGKGLMDNVLSDYLWARAVVLTTTTAASAGLSIQVPLAAVVDTLMGRPPKLINCVGAVAVIVGFVGINIPSDAIKKDNDPSTVLENNCGSPSDCPDNRCTQNAM